MKQIKDIKKKLKWEDYYDPTFNWDDWEFYKKNKLFEEFIREFQDKVNWYYISKYQTLSENFIREFQDKVNWKVISHYQKLSENFIREFQDRVDWQVIAIHQTLSKEFKEEFKDKNINFKYYTLRFLYSRYNKI